MNDGVQLCSEADIPNRAAELMWNHDCGFSFLMRDEASRILTGIITDRDIVMAAYTKGKTLSSLPVSAAMARGVKVCHPGDDISTTEALILMR
jgi:CBS domain-containing protein